jgi:PAS domain S-box-containing protein
MNTTKFFHAYFTQAQVNSILIMNTAGTILDLNPAFTINYGYTLQDLIGQNFSVLFTEQDRADNKPQLELQNCHSNGQSNDDNYVVSKGGLWSWSAGESVLMLSNEQEEYITKNIINLQSRKYLKLLLMETEELLGRAFETSLDIPMIILDGGMKIVKVNQSFLGLFEMSQAPPEGSSLSSVDHSFWKSKEVKEEVRSIIVTNLPLKNREFVLEMKAGEKKLVRLNSRIIDRGLGVGRKVFIMLDEVNSA